MSTFGMAYLTDSRNSYGVVETGVAGIGTRWHDAWGDIQKSIPLTTAPFTTTVTGSTPTIVPSLTEGELFTVTTPATDFSGINSQVTGEILKCTAGKPFKVYGKFKLEDATQSDFLFGVCATKTDLLATGTAHGITATAVEGLFFSKIDETTDINCHSYVNGAQTAIAAVGTMDTSAHVYEIDWDGSKVDFYFDGVLKATFAASLPTVDLTLSMNMRAGVATAKTFTVYPGLRAIQAKS